MLSLSDFFPLKSHTAMPSFNPFDERKLHDEYKPQFITYLRYPEEQDDTQPRAIPKEVVHEINGIPDKYITFEVWSNNLSALFLAAANTQPYSDIDLVFSLYIMKSKH